MYVKHSSKYRSIPGAAAARRDRQCNRVGNAGGAVQ